MTGNVRSRRDFDGRNLGTRCPACYHGIQGAPTAYRDPGVLATGPGGKGTDFSGTRAGTGST